MSIIVNHCQSLIHRQNNAADFRNTCGLTGDLFSKFCIFSLAVHTCSNEYPECLRPGASSDCASSGLWRHGIQQQLGRHETVGESKSIGPRGLPMWHILAHIGTLPHKQPACHTTPPLPHVCLSLRLCKA